MRIDLVVMGVVLATATACESPAVRWDEPMSAAEDTLGRLVIGQDGAVAFAQSGSPMSLPVDGARCERTIVWVRDGGQWYAAWFSRRGDSTIAVLAARSSDSGRAWSAAAMIDSVDVGRVGCARPGPSIAASDGYVHVAYSLQAPEGFGVFFAHSMDSTRTFHSPTTVIYGDRLSATSVAATGMQVAVAYEDPSGVGHRIDVALSRTQGHTFEARERGSPDEMAAIQPEVAVRDSTVAVSFVQPSGGSRIVRIGRIH